MMHAVLAPSSAHRWVNCPGSVQAEQQYPDIETDESIEGTAAHWVASEVLTLWKKHDGGCPSCNTYIDQIAPNGVVITDEIAESAQEYVGDVLKVAQDNGYLQLLSIETPVVIPRVHDLNWGTPDCNIWDANKLKLTSWDFKHGHLGVECYENWQQINYVIGLVDHYMQSGKPGLEDQAIDVEMRIVQPRAFHPEGTIRSWKLKASNLRGYANQLKVAAEQSQIQEPPTKAGLWCRHCKASGDCLTLQKDTAAIHDRIETLQLHDLSPEAAGVEIDYLRRAKTMIKERLEALETESIERTKQGSKIPGWGLGNSRGSTIWTKPVKEVIALGDLLGINLRKEENVITPKQATKLKVDESVINSYSKTVKGKQILVRDNETISARIFRNNQS